MTPIKTQKMWRPARRTTNDTAKHHDLPAGEPKKVKRQARGHTADEMADEDTNPRYRIRRRHIWRIEPCYCKGACTCPEDGRLTYKRKDDYDATVVHGSRSTYCFKFDKKALHLLLRQFSCYCRWCVRWLWHSAKCWRMRKRAIHLI